MIYQNSNLKTKKNSGDKQRMIPLAVKIENDYVYQGLYLT